MKAQKVHTLCGLLEDDLGKPIAFAGNICGFVDAKTRVVLIQCPFGELVYFSKDLPSLSVTVMSDLVDFFTEYHQGVTR